MTAEVIVFVPQAEAAAEANVANFVRYAREELTIFGADLCWDATSWDISDAVQWAGKTHSFRLHFYRGSRTNHEAFKAPWADFLRAYVRYLYGTKRRKTLDIKLLAARSLIDAVARPLPSLSQLRAHDFDRAATLISGRYSAGAAYNYGKALAELAKFLSDHHMLATPFSWSNFLPRHTSASGHIRVGPAFNGQRERLMPSTAAQEAIPRLYRSATRPSDVMALSMLALLHVAPMRISELLTLPVNCEHEEEGPEGTVYGLRWYPVKGAEPQIKWIPRVWTHLAKEALSKIRHLTDYGRTLAKWYAHHATVYIRPECVYAGGLRATQAELAQIFGVTKGTAERKLNSAGVRAVPSAHGGAWAYDFARAQSCLALPLPRGFPILDARSQLHLADALFCVSHGFGRIHQEALTPYPMALSQGWLAARVSERQDNQKTVFERHGIVDSAGIPVTVTSHQFRHWLNTLAQREGMDQLDLAAWSGRANVRQNEAYDHLPASELHTQLRQIRDQDHDRLKVLHDAPVPNMHAPVTRAAFLQAKYPAAHTTDLGLCVHDFSLLPCQQHGDCFNCNEHTIVKGNGPQSRAAQQRLKEAESLLSSATEGHQQAARGADRWLEHQRRTVARLKKIVSAHTDPSIENGTLVELPVECADSELHHVLNPAGTPQ